jgi:long-chain acyl-CoA synthetase
MQTLVSLFEKSVKSFKNNKALKMRPRWRMISWTYHDLKEYAYKIAAMLESHGVGYGDKVILISQNSPYWVGAFFGILHKGAVVVPLNPQSSEEFLNKIIKATGAKVVLKSFILFSKNKIKIPVVDIETFTSKSKFFEKHNVKPDDVAEIVYTSGTTGDPKGVVLTHRNIYSNLESISGMSKITTADRTVAVLPLFHMYEQTCEMFTSLKNGACILFSTSVSTRAIQRSLQDQKATKLLVVPELLETILRKIESKARENRQKRKLKKLFAFSKHMPKFLQRLLFRNVHKKFGGKLKIIACGGAALSEEVERKWDSMGFTILQGYGLTETSPVISSNTEKQKRVGSVGKVVPGVNVSIGEDKEILVKGPNVFSSYYKNEEKTKEVFDEDGRFKTGDMGYFDDDKYLHISGRKKYVIVSSSGENIYPEDIEREFKNHSQIKDVAVVGYSLNGREIVYAVFLSDSDDVGEIVAKVNRKLLQYQRIQDWAIWPDTDFPRSAIRKVKKNDVLEWLKKKEEDEETTSKPAKVSKLVSLLSSVCGKKTDKIHYSSKLYSDLHLDSLMRIELVSRIEDVFDVCLDENVITHKTTVDELEDLLEGKRKERKAERKFNSWVLSKTACVFRWLLQRIIFFPYIRIFLKIKVEGIKNLKKLELPAIFMCNHLSYIDAALVLKALPVKIRNKIAIAAAMDVLYQDYKYASKLAELIFNTYVLPRRETDNIKPGLDRTGRILDKNYSVLIFPEGEVSLTNKLLPLKKGAGLLAVEMGVPVVPIIIKDVKKFIGEESVVPNKRGTVKVKFGKPIVFDSKVSYDEAIKKIYDAMKILVKKTG